MPTLNWIGKDAVVRHHKEVPFRLLESDKKLSHGDPASGNLIVEGDNLHALKALLPRYAGKVKCIYIDPPYNTGNEGWVYNDNVNAPEILRWLGRTVGKEAEDLSRHDKWLCMMYPRLVLLKQFLSEDGAIFISIDDNEAANLKLIMDEVLGGGAFLADVVWRSSDNSNNDAKGFSSDHNHTLVYARSPDWQPNKTFDPEKQRHFKNPDDDPDGPWFDGNPLNSPNFRENLIYELVSPSGIVIKPPRNGWRWSQATMQEKINSGEIRYSGDERRIYRRTYLRDSKGLPPSNLWTDLSQTGHNRQAKYELMDIFRTEDSKSVFATPKPTRLIEKILQISTDPDSIILDSFAGSGTTAHAVLKQNAADGGNRKFILVEMEPGICRDITAERVRRVAGGYTNAKGEKVEGLGGGFQYCRLSKEPLFDATGAVRDDVRFAQLAEFVWFAETGTGFARKASSPLLGVHEGVAVYLLYNGILKDKSVDGGNVLTAPVLALLPPHDGPKVIYAAASRLGAPRLQRERIVFKQTPYALDV
ncbi:MAG: site-specific DNA-methyltransferase [Verrucomicrobiota bacterium]